MTIDFHTHAFPDKVAPRALENLADEKAGIIPHTDGTVAGLLRAMDQARVEKAVVLPIATRPSSQAHINDWAAANRSERLEIFATIHPDAPDALMELDRICDLGLKGVKLHPDYQNFFVDEPRMEPIYRKIGRLGLITVFHAGIDVSFPPPAHCSPERLARMLPAFEGAPVVAAHFGGYMQWEQVLEHLCGRDVYLDTSYTQGRIPLPWARSLVERHGADRILFGSDTPWGKLKEEIAQIGDLTENEQERRMMLYGNAARLLSGR